MKSAISAINLIPINKAHNTMKTLWSIFLINILFLNFGFSTSNIENEIRALEGIETQAILSYDFKTLESIWANDFMINNP